MPAPLFLACWTSTGVIVGASQQVRNRASNPHASAQYSATLTETMGWTGNSFTQNQSGDQGLGAFINRVLDGEQPTNTVDLNPITVDANTVGDPSGWFFGQALSDICFSGTPPGSTDAVDNIITNGVGTYDSLVFTSGWRQDANNTLREDIGLGTGNQFTAFKLYKRQLIAELDAAGYTGPVLFRMSQEGITANADPDYTDITRQVRVMVNAAKQLEQEALALTIYNVPDFYVWYRLTVGNLDGVTAGTAPFDPVPLAQAFTHSAPVDGSDQPGNLNVAWLQRTQNINNNGDLRVRNAHQSLLGQIVNACTWCYSIYGIDPADAISYFTAPFAVPLNDENRTLRYISSDGLRIYGGQLSSGGGAGGGGVDPYNNSGLNPGADPLYGGGPFDTDMDFAWSPTFRTQIADRVRSAVDDFYAGNTGLEI